MKGFTFQKKSNALASEGKSCRPETITAENQNACHDLWIWNKRETDHICSIKTFSSSALSTPREKIQWNKQYSGTRWKSCVAYRSPFLHYFVYSVAKPSFLIWKIDHVYHRMNFVGIIEWILLESSNEYCSNYGMNIAWIVFHFSGGKEKGAKLRSWSWLSLYANESCDENAVYFWRWLKWHAMFSSRFSSPATI